MAGIVLGPSVLGHFFPGAFEFLFEPSSLVPLNVISQIGLVLFMFVIGMELDLSVVRRKASETLVISHASIIVPFFLGLVLAYWVYPEFGAHHAPFLSFALFIGISVSITAFPVLARIVQAQRRQAPMGMLAIASAANNDVTAWCLLAAVIAVARQATRSARSIRCPDGRLHSVHVLPRAPVPA
ncbi:MAG: cation:proton antiporter [Alistipes sp.]